LPCDNALTASGYTLVTIETTTTATISTIYSVIEIQENQLNAVVDFRNIPINSFNVPLTIIHHSHGNTFYLSVVDKADEETVSEVTNIVLNKPSLLTITPICASAEEKYCLFSLSSSYSSFMLDFKSKDAIESFHGKNNIGKGTYNGIFNLDLTDYFWKSWEGSLVVTPFDEPKVTANFYLYKNRTEVKFVCSFSGFPYNVSYSSYNVGSDIFRTMNAFGIKNDTFSPNIMHLADTGEIIIYSPYDEDLRNSLQQTNTRKTLDSNDEIDFKWLVGIDDNMTAEVEKKSFVVTEEEEDGGEIGSDSGKPEEDNKMTIIVVASCVVVVIIIVSIIVVVWRNRSRRISNGDA